MVLPLTIILHSARFITRSFVEVPRIALLTCLIRIFGTPSLAPAHEPFDGAPSCIVSTSCSTAFTGVKRALPLLRFQIPFAHLHPVAHTAHFHLNYNDVRCTMHNSCRRHIGIARLVTTYT